MESDDPRTNGPSSALGAADGLGTNRMDEIRLAGAPLQNVKRRFKRQNTILQGQYPNVNLVMGSTCETGCKAIVRIQLDQLKADGTLDRLEKPITIFTGSQFEHHINKVEGDVLVVGDCAKGMLEKFLDTRSGASAKSTRIVLASGQTVRTSGSQITSAS
jgi:hypothetical protein